MQRRQCKTCIYRPDTHFDIEHLESQVREKARATTIDFADMVAKGRRVNTSGIDRYNAKLTEQSVRQIRVSSYSERALAKKYHVGRITIRSVKGRLRWAHVV